MRSLFWPVFLLTLASCASSPETARQIVDGDYSWAPYISYDRDADRFRLYYHKKDGARFLMMARFSKDGRNWSSPQEVRSEVQADGASWGANVIDTGVHGPRRFRNIHYWIGPGANGAYLSNSPDGINWDVPTSRSSPIVDSDDQLNPFRLPDGKFGLFTKPRNTPLRETWISFGDAEMENWSKPIPAFQRSEQDHPKLEFYGAACCINRDGRILAFLRVLRDDIASGQGYTVMAWSADSGRTWTRQSEPFFGRCENAPDAAHAWIYGVTEARGTVYFSYSAYPQGHKVGERYVGVATMRSADLDVGAVGPPC